MSYNPKTLEVSQGGTSRVSLTAYNLIVGNGTSSPTLLAPNSTSGIPLVSQGSSADPAYSTAVVAGGGTGATSFTAYSVLCGGTTSTGAFQNVSGVGTSGQVLTSNGASALPSWTTVSGGSSTYFQAVKTSSSLNATGDGTQVNPIIFDSAITNQGSGYNTSTGVFTCPTTDFYFFNVGLYLTNFSAINNNNISASIQYSLFITRFMMNSAGTATTGGVFSFPMCGGAYLTAGTQVSVSLIVDGSSKQVNIVGGADHSTYFSAFSLH